MPCAASAGDRAADEGRREERPALEAVGGDGERVGLDAVEIGRDGLLVVRHGEEHNRGGRWVGPVFHAGGARWRPVMAVRALDRAGRGERGDDQIQRGSRDLDPPRVARVRGEAEGSHLRPVEQEPVAVRGGVEERLDVVIRGAHVREAVVEHPGLHALPSLIGAGAAPAEAVERLVVRGDEGGGDRGGARRRHLHVERPVALGGDAQREIVRPPASSVASVTTCHAGVEGGVDHPAPRRTGPAAWGSPGSCPARRAAPGKRDQARRPGLIPSGA